LLCYSKCVSWPVLAHDSILLFPHTRSTNWRNRLFYCCDIAVKKRKFKFFPVANLFLCLTKRTRTQTFIKIGQILWELYSYILQMRTNRRTQRFHKVKGVFFYIRLRMSYTVWTKSNFWEMEIWLHLCRSCKI